MSRPTDRRRYLVYVGLALASCREEPAGDPCDVICTHCHSSTPLVHVSELNGFAERAASAPTLRSTWEASCERGRPLLVVLASVDRRTNTMLSLFSALLCHGSDQELAALAPFDLACATEEEVAEFVGARVDKAARAILLQARVGIVGAVDVVTFAANLPELVIQPRTIESIGDAVARDAYDTRQRERIAILAEALRHESSPDAAVGAAAAATPATTTVANDLSMLAKSVRERWSAHPPAGTRWASNDGCGTRIEDGQALMIECGMAYVPDTSRRFPVRYVEVGSAR